MIGCVGDDVFGESLTRGLRDDGVDCRGVRVVPGSSGVALIVVDGAGRNGIVVVPGANGQLSPADVDGHEALLAGARVVALQLEVPFATVEHAVARARALGKLVILNPAPARPLPADLLRRLDFLVVNEIEAEALSGVKVDSAEAAAAAGRRLRQAGAASVLVTLGAQGVVTVAAGAEPRHDPAPRVQVVDTTAAGDTFIGGLCAGLTEGRPLPEAIRLAQAAAALSVTRFGAQTSIPRRSEVDF